MPIIQCYLPEGGKGFKWGHSGKCYASRADAEKQAAAAHAAGFAGDRATVLQQRETIERIALDYASVRSKDADGRLHVAVSNISKAVVSPYYGYEIPGADGLGLKPDQVYQLLRDPEELRKAVDSFNNIPLIIKHKPTTADAHDRELVVGTMGGDAEFDGTYLKNSLVVWDQEGIDAIETKTQRELSCGYRYVVEMVPGVFDGIKYDGRMTQIIGNHVALVEVGRAGPDVFVFDSLPLELSDMKPTRKAKAFGDGLAVYLRPRLAQDAALEPAALALLIDKAAFDRPKIAAGVTAMFKGKLAQDADLGDIAEILEAVAPVVEAVAEEDPAALDEGDDKYAALVAKLRETLSPEQCAALGLDEADPDAPESPEGGNPEPDTVSKQAMDAAIKKAGDDAYSRAMKEAAAVRTAEKEVAPLVGEIAAMDSAESVYRFALDQAGIDTKGVHASALRVLVQQAVQHKSQQVRVAPSLAQDAAAGAAFAKRFPNLKFPQER